MAEVIQIINMDRWILTLLTTLAVLLAMVPTGLGVKCYSCNSAEHLQGSGCKDKPDEIYLKNCDEEDVELNRTYTMCRIMVQEVEGDTRIVRTCATAGRPERGCIDRTGTSKIKLRYCECDNGDGCNAADRMTSHHIMTSLVLLIVAAITRL